MKSMLMKPMKNMPDTVEFVKDSPRYPWGLNIGLENEVLENLGIEKLPSVGDVVVICAKARVESVSMSENQDKTKNRRVQLQITDMEIEDDIEEEGVAKKLYGA